MDKLSNSMRRPLGLVLSGGGALGAWQAGALSALVEGGLVFDHVLGFSSGSLNGLLYFLGREAELESSWLSVGYSRVFKLSIARSPLSFFSEQPLRERLFFAQDDRKLRQFARCTFTVVSLCLDDLMPVYARFSPPGHGAWDAPIIDWVVASCAIPFVFPPVTMNVRGQARAYIDGGVPGREWMRFDALSACKDVLVLEMVRPQEVGRFRWGPVARLDQKSREIVRRHIDHGAATLAQLPDPPRVRRLAPSSTLDYYQLSFSAKHCARAFKAGFADAKAFLDAVGTP